MDKAGIHELLQAHEDAQFGMAPGQAALEVDRIGRTDGPVCGELDGAALHEGACGHDHLAVVARHVPGNGGHVGIHRRCGLNALAEGAHGLFAAQFHGLDDVVPVLIRTRDARKAQTVVDGSCEHGALHGAGGDGGGEEKALVQGGHEPKVGAHLLAQAGGGEAVGTPVHAGLCAADVSADGGQASARVFDEGADDHVGPKVGGLDLFGELAVAVVHHADEIRLDVFHKGDQLADLGDGKGRPRGVALGALDGDQFGAFIDGEADLLIVDFPILERDLGIGDPVLGQRAGALSDADDLLQGVIGAADRGKQFIARQKIGGQGDSQGMGAADDLRTDQSGLRMKGVRIDPLQGVAAQIVVAVAAGGSKAGGADPVFLHGRDDLGLVVFRDAVNGVEAGTQRCEQFFTEGEDGIRNADLPENIICHEMILPI